MNEQSGFNVRFLGTGSFVHKPDVFSNLHSSITLTVLIE